MSDDPRKEVALRWIGISDKITQFLADLDAADPVRQVRGDAPGTGGFIVTIAERAAELAEWFTLDPDEDDLIFVEKALRQVERAALERARYAADQLNLNRGTYGQGVDGLWTAYIQSRRDVVALIKAMIDAPASEAPKSESLAEDKLWLHLEQRIEERLNLHHLYHIEIAEDGPEAFSMDGAGASVLRVVRDAISEAGWSIRSEAPDPRDAAKGPIPLWTEGVCGDGAAILCDGIMVPIEKVIEALNRCEASGKADPRDAEIKRLRSLVSACGRQFRDYERQHLAKSPPDSMKAATNARFAEICEGLGHAGDEGV